MLVQLDRMKKEYDGFSLELNMEIPENQVTGLIGANGAGKSTTFKLMLGLIRPDEGNVEIFGRNAAEMGAEDKQKIGILRQRIFRIFESTAAYSNHEPFLSGFSGRRVSWKM